MPEAKRSTTSRSRPRSFKEPAALKRFNKSIDTAERALAELKEHAGRDVSQAVRDLYKDLRTFVSSARRDSGKFAKALQRDFEQAEKRVSQRLAAGSTGIKRAAKRTTTTRDKRAG